MMKKVLFVAILSMASLFLSAQHVEFGLKTGLNIANLKDKNGNPNDYYHTKLGVYGGVFTHVHITNRWAVQPEIVFSQQGTKFGNGSLPETDRTLNYLNLPVLVQYMTTSGFRLQAGPQIGFLLSARDEFQGIKTNVKEDIKSTEFAMVFGAGYLTKFGLGFDARLNAGLTDIRKSSSLPTPKYRNDVVQLGIFYQFRPASKKS